MMHKRGQVPWVVVELGLALIILLVAPAMFKPTLYAATRTWDSSDAKLMYTRCVINGGLQRSSTTCTIDPKLDADGDCAPDYCDPCILGQEGKDKKGIELEQIRGSNLCDQDLDNVPDACDTNPYNPNIIKCTSTLDDGRCNKLSEEFKARPPKCSKKAFSPV